MMKSDIIYEYKGNVYLNITNKCPCRCTFCIRNSKDKLGGAQNLWLEHEPSLEEIYMAIKSFPLREYEGVVFCGYGEPVMALETLKSVSCFIREEYQLPIRVNTNGLGNLIHQRSVAKDLCQAADSISISLNAPDAESYLQLVQPAYGEKSFASMLEFARECRQQTENIQFTVVSIIGEEAIEKCRRLAMSMNIPLRVREYKD